MAFFMNDSKLFPKPQVPMYIISAGFLLYVRFIFMICHDLCNVTNYSILNDLRKVYYNDIQYLCSCKQETARYIKFLWSFFISSAR